MLEREWISAQRSQLPLSLIILDIDFFKQYNDHYGHIKGDECLRQVANTLSQAANRPRDFIARIGGEEFVWLLPETDAPSAKLVAQRCLHLVRQQQIEHGSSPISKWLSLSLGVGTHTVTPNSPMLGFVEQVDKLLYQAKRNGRMRAELVSRI